ncbi:AMP-binding protein [Zwartia sp.]|uniref:AMP-binding protein n=1 Tax=Zwartia sp. TaxID=2978004 RepID=UPI002717C98D|nr:AMP-binding protein [Zwartia sp.]MDO9025554.1 AMP-binding protein [Zwartia sp.]
MQYPWIKHYPEGVPADVSIEGYRSLVDLLDQACRTYAPRIAARSFGVSLTFEQLDHDAQAFAGWLQSLRLPRGSRIALMMPNVLPYLVAMLGTLRAGHVIVNINPLCTARELSIQLNDSGACTIVVLESVALTLEQVTDCPALQHRVVVPPGAMLGRLKGMVINLGARYIKKLGPEKPIAGAWSWDAVLREGRGFQWVAPEIGLEDLAALQYTGGTTGQPKGAMLTHGNLVANVLQVEAVARPALHDLLAKPLTMLTALPLYHVFAMTVCGFYALHAGMKSVLVLNPRDRASLVHAWREDPPHIFPGVNTLFNALAHDEAFSRLDFSSLRLAFGGGMAIQRTVAERWVQLTGRPLIEGYGLSETSPVVAANPTNGTQYSGSVGLPVPSTEICILDPQGGRVDEGQNGEVAIRGPQVMRGYWHAELETAAVMTEDGFLRTGDIGHMDARGYLYLVDRKKDLIVVSGFNVYPSEIEAVVSEMPGVLECAAVGLPSTDSGEVVKLFVVRRDPLLDEATIQDWCQQQLSRYKCPKRIEFRDELPKSNVGKILRRALRDV